MDRYYWHFIPYKVRYIIQLFPWLFTSISESVDIAADLLNNVSSICAYAAKQG